MRIVGESQKSSRCGILGSFQRRRQRSFSDGVDVPNVAEVPQNPQRIPSSGETAGYLLSGEPRGNYFSKNVWIYIDYRALARLILSIWYVGARS